MLIALTLGLVLGLGSFPIANGAVVTDPLLASNKTFDFIVVGGGLAGLTVRSHHSTRVARSSPSRTRVCMKLKVAGRLSENPSITVLVIEAGPDSRQDPCVYDIYRYGQAFHSDIDWSYPTDQKKTIRA